MMEQARWAGLSVQSFFQGYNWSGEVPKLEPTITESQVEVTLPSLLCLKVGDFLRKGNWQGLSQAVISFSTEQEQRRSESVPFDAQSSLQLSVLQFFQQANWKGQGYSMAASPVPEKKVSSLPVPGNTELDLTDLSALF